MRGNQHRATLALCAVAALAIFVTPSRAEEGLLDFLFGPSEPDRAAPSQHAPRSDWGGARRSKASGERTARAGEGAGEPSTGGYCVRVCDGYYFPLIKSSHASRQQSCEFACPSAPMAIYDGGSIETARNYKGERYSALPTAFAFRDKAKQKCSCNDPGSSAAFFERTVKTDPTLRSGDVVFDSRGALIFSGANLVPLSQASFAPRDVRERLRAVTVRGGDAAPVEPDSAPVPEVELGAADRTGGTTR